MFYAFNPLAGEYRCKFKVTGNLLNHGFNHGLYGCGSGHNAA